MKILLSLLLSALAMTANAESGFIAEPVPGVDPTTAPARPTAYVGPLERGTCDHPHQEGCWDLGILNIVHNPQLPILADADQPPRDQAERLRRQNEMGPDVWQGYLDGVITPSAPHRFLVMVWNVGDGSPTGYRINGCQADDCTHHVTNYAPIEEVTGKIRPLNFDQTVVKLPNVPDRAFMISADGFDPIAATMQFPVGMIDVERTYILICSEDGVPIYPSKQRNEGLWGAPATIAHLMREQAHGSFAVFSFPPVVASR